MSESKTPMYKNDYGIVVRGYESRLGGLYKSEDVALRVGKETDPVHALVRFSDVVHAFVDLKAATAESELIAAQARIAELESAPWVCDDIRTLKQKLSGALIERDMARAQRDALTDRLTRIHALIQPPHVVLPDGRRMQFVPPLDLLVETWGALSKAIREIPDTIHAPVAALAAKEKD